MSKKVNGVAFLGDAVSVEEYCAQLTRSIDAESARLVNKDAEWFPWNSAISDHKPVWDKVVLSNGGVLTLTTWNVLNKKYALKYMGRTDKNDGQRLWHLPMTSPDPAVQTRREQQICESVVKLLHADRIVIVCLQEVSGELLEMLTTAIGVDYHILATRENYEGGLVPVNCNVTIVRGGIRLLSERPFLDQVTKGTSVQKAVNYHVFELWHKGAITKFGVLNVHLSYSATDDYVKKMLALDLDSTLIVMGDFNRGVRYPLRVALDGTPQPHMNVYSDARFKFSLNDANPSSHVCYYNNVGGDMLKMLDRFDHIMLLEMKEQEEEGK